MFDAANNDFANGVEIKADLAELRAELEQLRQEIASFQDEPEQDREVPSLLGMECQSDIVPAQAAVVANSPLENLQRLLARSRGEE